MYVYPYYHRKYIFVSFGGYWPAGYSYLRYYNYGYHPYRWYGYYPREYPLAGDTYNYYTYNYDDVSGGGAVPIIGAADGITPADEYTFADVRERMAQEDAQEPAAETQADRYFEKGVKAFEKGDYAEAVEVFHQAVLLEPEDIVLPFTYAQALFANSRYPEAAGVLRKSIERLDTDEQGIFYPRGLYSQDSELLEQVDKLRDQSRIYSFDADLQFLLGYQLIGTDRYDEAAEALDQASLDFKNAPAAEKLLHLLEKITAEKTNTPE